MIDKNSLIFCNIIKADLPSISKSGNENDGPLSKLVNPVTAWDGSGDTALYVSSLGFLISIIATKIEVVR